jgi:hypothetical protein
MYPYVLLDVYEGIVLKNDSTQLQGGILRGLKTCIGIVITSEKYLIILHHPAFIVDNTFQEIQNWVDKTEFGPIHEIYVYKNDAYPLNTKCPPSLFCQLLKDALHFPKNIQITHVSDPVGMFQINKSSPHIATSITIEQCRLGEPPHLNANKTLMSRAHYLSSRLAYHRGDFSNCRIKIMTRINFGEKPSIDSLAPEIQQHIARITVYAPYNIQQLATQLCTNPIWAKVFDLDRLDHTEGSLNQLIIKLENYCVFLLQCISPLDEVKQKYIHDIKQLSQQKNILITMIHQDSPHLDLLEDYMLAAHKKSDTIGTTSFKT